MLVDLVKELNNDIWHSGTVYERSFLHDQNMRTYLLYVPADYNGSQKWPLIINYHGYTGDATEPDILGNNNNDINASSEILNFFKRNPLRGLSTAIDDLSNKPSGFWLMQNFPNPFNTTTMISYTIGDVRTRHAVSQQVQVELSICNLLGQKVATLVDKKQTAGNYEVEWDARGFSSGIYMYTLETSAGFRQSRKLVLLK